MKIKNPNAPVTNKVFWQGINSIIDLFEKTEKRNEERHIENKEEHKQIKEELRGEMQTGFAKLDRKIDNLAANTPTRQEFEAVKKLQN